MLIKLPKTGPGVRFLESSSIKALSVAKFHETARDPAIFIVSMLDDKQKELARVDCVSSEAADNLMDEIATLCNPGEKV